MSTAVTETAPQTVQLKLRGPDGYVWRNVSTAEPRDATLDEIPLIDISGIYGDFKARKQLASEVKTAVEGYGFFYIKNHGIPNELTENAAKQTKAFFKQPDELKEAASTVFSKFNNGWFKKNSRRVSATGAPDYKEAFFFRYEPENDPETNDPSAVPEEVKPFIRGEKYIWDATSHLPEFKHDIIAYWQACLQLARRLIRIFALVLELPEDYYDSVTTYPGADAVLNWYPGQAQDQTSSQPNAGLGSHTDLQCFTLLWQDMIGGLQVLTNDGQWIKAAPIPDTFVVNIADFLTRLSNGRLRSTVHRVSNENTEDRISMPFFFGFNPNETLSVVPTCIDENNPAKYEPISCGEYLKRRFEEARTAVQ